MALKHVILGLLALFGPRSGYTLHKDFFEPGRPTTSEVYRALKGLKQENFVEYNRIYGLNEPSKNIIRISPGGYEELSRWLKEKDFAGAMQEPLMGKIWFGNTVGTESILDSLQAYIKERQGELDYYKVQLGRFIDNPARRKSATASNKLYWTLVFDYIIPRSEFDIKWAEQSIAKLQSSTTGRNSESNKHKKSK